MGEGREEGQLGQTISKKEESSRTGCWIALLEDNTFVPGVMLGSNRGGVGLGALVEGAAVWEPAG